MTNTTKILIVCLCLLHTHMTSAQQKVQDRAKVEENTAPFSPDYFNKKKNSYYVLTTTFVENRLILNEETRVTEVSGKMPYQSGRLNVRVMNGQGKVISSYFMQDPMVVRSCEDEKSEVTRLEKGTIQIMLPKSRDIATVELIKDKKSLGRVNIGKVMDKFLKDRQNEGRD